MRIAINGFGRIGRSILRAAAQHPDIEIVLINDVAGLDAAAYLFEFDSIFGPWAGEVDQADDCLIIDGRRIPFHCSDDIGSIDLAGIDVVAECTGQRQVASMSRRALNSGARRVLVSGPSDEAEITLVMGANQSSYNGERVVSNASCTTNAIAPLLSIVDAKFGVTGGHMTTVHCYTGSQPTVDQARGDPARSRAAALSVVPTTTSAHRLLGDVLPHLAGRIEARALRVPVASVSSIDLTVLIQSRVEIATVQRVLKNACASSNVLGWTEKPLVSTDLRGRPESLIISGPELSLSAAGTLLRVFGWYDNEWGFANRMLDMAAFVGRV